MLKKISEYISNIPDSIINLISIFSGVVTLLAPIIGLSKIGKSILESDGNKGMRQLLILIIVSSVAFIVLLFLRIRKYRSLMIEARKSTSQGFKDTIGEFRELYFRLLKVHKGGKDEIDSLTHQVNTYIQDSLDKLCSILESFTRQKICACVKLIETEDGKLGGEIDIEHATVKTCARSRNTGLDRGAGDTVSVGPKIKDNTDFYSILSEDDEERKPYFYKGNLIKYEKELQKADKDYKNTTRNWKKYYKGTVVVPIRAKNKSLHFVPQEDTYNIIAFLCVDSMSTSAFLDSQEAYNCAVLKAFASIYYIILNKYTYYLQKIDERSTGGQETHG